MKWKWNLSLKLTLRGYVENGIYMNASKYSIPCIGIRQRFNSCLIYTCNITTIEKFILINSFGYECYFGLIKEFVASVLQIWSFMGNKGEFYLPSQLPNTNPSWAVILKKHDLQPLFWHTTSVCVIYLESSKFSAWLILSSSLSFSAVNTCFSSSNAATYHMYQQSIYT